MNEIMSVDYRDRCMQNEEMKGCLVLFMRDALNHCRDPILA